MMSVTIGIIQCAMGISHSPSLQGGIREGFSEEKLFIIKSED